jgi:hypothetical protein
MTVRKLGKKDGRLMRSQQKHDTRLITPTFVVAKGLMFQSACPDGLAWQNSRLLETVFR